MRDWSLHPGDPLALVIAADARLCKTDYLDDQIWELDIGSGDPPALALRTTYGLRARAVRLFPRFTQGGKAVSNPSDFAAPPEVRRFYPNFLEVIFSPIVGIEIVAEYWVPESNIVAGRLTIYNVAVVPQRLNLEWVGLMTPIEGENISQMKLQSVNVLAGKTGNLAPVVFLTGGPQVSPGPYPSLVIDLDLLPGASRQLTWVHAALSNTDKSFELARLTAARPWEAERARIEMVNASQIVDIETGDPDWDAAFALSQKTALGLFYHGGDQLPEPSFVLNRTPDQGYSRRGDGNDYGPLWNGQPPLETYFLSSVLPGAPNLIQGLLKNYLSSQARDGLIDGRPGLAGQRGRFLAAPLLASLVWELYSRNQALDYLSEIFDQLLAYFRKWVNSVHDRKGGGLPVWEHPIQTGFEDNPLFAPWAQGIDIAALDNPSLFAGLYREATSLASMAALLDRPEEAAELEDFSRRMKDALDGCWDADSAVYRYRDRDTLRFNQPGLELGRRKGRGTLRIKAKFDHPVRLLVHILSEGQVSLRPTITISQFVTKDGGGEKLARQSFQWNAGNGVATSQQVYTRVGRVRIAGIGKDDEVIISTVDTTGEDQSLFLPLWAGVPTLEQAEALVTRALFASDRFGYPFGIPACRILNGDEVDDICVSVHMPWNQMIGEGLVAYGFHAEAVRLVTRLMGAVVKNLKRNRAFFRYYHAENGNGVSERNALGGLAPVGLFLKVLGVEILSPAEVRLSGDNPFPWTVVIKYRGLRVIRYADKTDVIFPDGREQTISDPAPIVVR